MQPVRSAAYISRHACLSLALVYCFNKMFTFRDSSLEDSLRMTQSRTPSCHSEGAKRLKNLSRF